MKCRTEDCLRRLRPRLAAGWALIATIALSGCAKSTFETAPVHGKITVDGKPLTSGSVNFVPEKGRSATGQVQPDGTYILGTYTDSDGAMVGKHRVAIDTRNRVKRGEQDDEGDDLSASPLLPARYAIDANSGLSYEVKADEDNEANFDLSSK